MARPRTTSKPKKKAPKPEPEIAPVKVGRSTGLEVPEAKAEKICAAHLAGMGVKQICRAFNTSHHTVAAIIRNRPELLERAREITSKNWRTLAAMGTAELFERVPDMKSHELTIMSAVATEKSELLSGGATQRVEHVMQPAAESWDSFVRGLKSEQVIDVTPEAVDITVGSPERAGQTEAPALPEAPIASNHQSADVDIQPLTQ
jgi:hypothetical protein